MGFVLALVGCSAESELTRLDPALTAEGLRQGKVAVLGVVKLEEPDQVRPPLIATLEAVWSAERPDVPMMTADSVKQVLGAERDRKLLLGYEYQGELDAPALSELADSLRGLARYVIVARVDKDKSRNSTRGISTSDTTSSAHVLYAMGVTGRDAVVTVKLYDLTRRAVVVSGRFEGTSENEHPMISPMYSGTIGGGSTGGTVTTPPVPPEERNYPELPELAMALQGPFRNFARMLPGSPVPAAAPPPAGRR